MWLGVFDCLEYACCFRVKHCHAGDPLDQGLVEGPGKALVKHVHVPGQDADSDIWFWVLIASMGFMALGLIVLFRKMRWL